MTGTSNDELSIHDLLRHLQLMTQPDPIVIKRGEDFVKFWMKRSSWLHDLVGICFESSVPLPLKVLSAQFIYRKMDKGEALSKDQVQLLSCRVFASEVSNLETPIRSAICRISARLLRKYLRPQSISDVFTLHESVCFSILTELGLEVTPKDPLATAWALELLNAIERLPALGPMIYELLIIWVPVFEPSRIINSRILSADSNAADDLILKVSEIHPASQILRHVAAISDLVTALAITANIGPVLILQESLEVSEYVARVTRKAVETSDLEILEQSIGFWEKVAVFDPRFIETVCSIGEYPETFEHKFAPDDRDRFHELRRDLRDCLRAIGKKACTSFAPLLTGNTELNWRAAECRLHAISAVSKFLNGTQVAEFVNRKFLPLITSDSRFATRPLLATLMLCMHVFPLLRTPELTLIAIDCLRLPHYAPPCPYVFASKQDHAAVVALTRCEWTKEVVEKFLSLGFGTLQKNLTEQSRVILLETAAEKLKAANDVRALIDMIQIGGNATDFVAVLSKYEKVTISDQMLLDVLQRGPIEAIPKLLRFCLARSPADRRHGRILELVHHSMSHHPEHWIREVGNLSEVLGGSVEPVAFLSSRLINCVSSLTIESLVDWMQVVLEFKSVLKDLEYWRDIAARMLIMQEAPAHKVLFGKVLD